MKANQDVRRAIKDSGFYLYEVAHEMSITEHTLIRWLRYELPEEKKKIILTSIQKLVSGND